MFEFSENLKWSLSALALMKKPRLIPSKKQLLNIYLIRVDEHDIDMLIHL